MEFQSFDHALKVCMESEEGSPEQDAALLFCMETAPPELMELLKARYLQIKESHQTGCGCGCGEEK